LRVLERSEVHVGDDRYQVAADIGKRQPAKATAPKLLLAGMWKKSPSNVGPVTDAQRLGLSRPTRCGLRTSRSQRDGAAGCPVHAPVRDVIGWVNVDEDGTDRVWPLNPAIQDNLRVRGTCDADGAGKAHYQ